MSTAAQFITGWLVGVGIYAALLYGVHLAFTRRERLASSARGAFPRRLEKHVERLGPWS